MRGREKVPIEMDRQVDGDDGVITELEEREGRARGQLI